jgi:hypothetical protein
MSSTASVPDVDNASAAELGQPLDEFDEYADAEKNFQPKSLKFWTIIIGMYMSIFLVALVSPLQCSAAPGLRLSRIEPLLRQPFQKLPTSSIRSMILAGMVVPTC